MFSSSLILLMLSACILARDSRTTSSSPSEVTAATTLNLFLGPGDSGAPNGFVGSIVHADHCGTTYALHCTEGAYTNSGIVSGFCDQSSTVTATYGPSSYGLYSIGTFEGVTVTNIQTCDLEGTTRAVCSITQTIVGPGPDTSTSKVETYSEADIVFGQVPITAGVSKLSNLAACTSTSSGGGAAATGLSEVYRVIIVPGAAAILAGYLV